MNNKMEFNLFDDNKEATGLLFPNTSKIKKDNQDRNKLINELGDKLSNKEILYSTKDELLAKKEKLKAKQTGFAVDINYDDIVNDKALSKDEKVSELKNRKNKIDDEIEREKKIKLGKIYSGGALELASGAIPSTGVAKIGGKALLSAGKGALKDKFGRKMLSQIGNATTNGALIGGIQGTGEAIREDKNVFGSALKNSAIGAITGLGTSSAVSAIERKGLDGIKNIKESLDDLNLEKRNKTTKNIKSYYQNYLQDTNLLTGDKKINFSKRGLQEVMRWNPNAGKNFPVLKKDIKTAKEVYTEPNKKPDIKHNVSHYEVYKGNYGEHLIEVDKQGKRRYYFTRSVPDSTYSTKSTNSTENAHNILPRNISDDNPIDRIKNILWGENK